MPYAATYPDRCYDDFYLTRASDVPALYQRLDPVVHGPVDGNHVFTPEDAKTFEENGFLVYQSLFDDHEIAAWQAELNRLCHAYRGTAYPEVVTERDTGEVRSIFAIHEFSDAFSELARDRRLAGLAKAILCDDVYLHQSRINYKPGFGGREFAWHSDFETWHAEDGMPRMRAVSMSLMLTDNHAFNGPLMLIPGSHMTFVSCVGATPDDHYKTSLQRQEFGVPDRETLSRMVDQHGIEMPTGKAGMLLVFDCNTIHGSNGNITPYPRSNAFFVYNAVSNAPAAPFAARKPRPYFLGSRNATPIRVH